MKFFAVFAAIVALAVAAPAASTWTLNELSAAILNPSTDPALLPYLEQALNQHMEALFAGQQVDSITVVTPAGLLPVEAVLPTTVSTWTLSQLSDAIQNPNTDPALMPYLEHALNQYMDALFAGQQLEAIAVVLPAGLLPTEVAEVAPVPAPALVDTKPEVAAPAASSPLVQIIVNIAGGQQSAAPTPAPAVNPTPVAPAAPIVTPDAVSVVDFVPAPVSVIEAVPEPVSVAELAPEPVSVAELAPVPESVAVAGPINPIDVVAVAAPEVNPIDLINPIVVLPVVAGQDIVGPIV